MLFSKLSHVVDSVLILIGLLRLVAATPSMKELKIETHNFTQKINHGSPDSGTFQQQYQIATNYFKPGGPILFLHSPQATTMASVESSVFSDYAPELGGLLVALEHRYFGKSFPENFNFSNPSAMDLAPVTLENYVQDVAVFIEWIKKTVPGAADSRAFNIGGSYGGFLVAQTKILSPNTFYGSFSTGAPFQSWGNQGLEGNSLVFAAQDTNSNAWFDASHDASVKVQDAMKTFKDCATSGECDMTLKDMNLCQSANATIWAALYNAASTTYIMLAQFNYGVKNFQFANAFPLQHAINETLKAASTSDVLRIPLLARSWSKNQSACIDTTNSNITNFSQTEQQGGTFQWITCQYYPFSLGSVQPGGLLPASGDVQPGPCAFPEWQALDFNETRAYWSKKLGLDPEQLDRVERLIITQGSSDMISGIGQPPLTSSSFRNHSRVIYVEGMAHGDNMLPYSMIPRGSKQVVDEVSSSLLLGDKTPSNYFKF